MNAIAICRLYVIVLGAGLLLEGATLLVLDALKIPAPITSSDVRHNVLHVVWGAALLAVGPWRPVWAALIFGTFYVALGIVGLTIDQPFGLQLGPAENIFHFTVGPLALLLGAWALRTMADQPVPSRSAARPALPRNSRANRRRARHRPGSGRRAPLRR